ncbi:hypothetical protein AFLA_000063 [Aspergillus flavus NRRL3357]|nr:hypothetical protein AFLA_000063 [Aspergillus flavus NRRL3357]
MTVDAQDSTPAPPADRRGAELETGGVGEQSEQPKNKSNGDGNAPAETGQKPNPKDPSRPRRKKARRACFACQRAHLTCGDERPCQRCIKRGLQDACHDGVRKKAKYLHDAPDGALMPGIGGNFYNNTMRTEFQSQFLPHAAVELL